MTSPLPGRDCSRNSHHEHSPGGPTGGSAAPGSFNGGVNRVASVTEKVWPITRPITAGQWLKEMWKVRMAYLFLVPAVAVLAILVAYPMVQGIAYSFTNIDLYNMGSHTAPPSYTFVGLQNYRRIFDPTIPDGKRFWDVLKQTIIWTVGNVSFHFLFGLGLAVLLNRRLPGRGVYRVLLLVPWALPSYVSAFAWRWIFNSQYGFLNLVLTRLGLELIPWLSHPNWAMVSVIMANIWLGVPFMMVVMLGGLQSINPELYAAAAVDGASRWQQFRYISLPLLKPVMAIAILLGTIWTFNNFNIIYLITQGGPVYKTEILITYAYFEAFTHWRIGIATAYTTVSLVILLVFTYFYIKVLRGIERGY